MASSTTFRTAFDVGVKRSSAAHWFPKHMNSGLKQMQAKIRSVDCILEVHDSRLPLSGRNPDFSHQVIGEKPHILILNKCDLITRKDQQRIRKVYDSSNTRELIFTNCKDDRDPGIKKIVPKVVEMIATSQRYHRSEMPDLHCMVIGVPNVGKSSFINIIRSRHLKKGRAVTVGPSAGVTKSVHEKVKIHEVPNIYLFDTPGILQPKIPSFEIGLKLAVCANLPDAQLGPRLIADYLLYTLNRFKEFKYVEALGLNAPSDCITTVLAQGAINLGFITELRSSVDESYVPKPDLDATATQFIRLFRGGSLGRILLDDLPSAKGELYAEDDPSAGYLDKVDEVKSQGRE